VLQSSKTVQLLPTLYNASNSTVIQRIYIILYRSASVSSSLLFILLQVAENTVSCCTFHRMNACFYVPPFIKQYWETEQKKYYRPISSNNTNRFLSLDRDRDRRLLSRSLSRDRRSRLRLLDRFRSRRLSCRPVIITYHSECFSASAPFIFSFHRHSQNLQILTDEVTWVSEIPHNTHSINSVIVQN